MDLRDYLDILRTRWRLITVTTLLGVMAAAIVSMLATPMYTANGHDLRVRSIAATRPWATALQGRCSRKTASSRYVDARDSRRRHGCRHRRRWARRYSRTRSPRQIDVNNPLDTVTLEISATDANAALAQSIANSTAEQLQAQVGIA